jgi:hypothetical protein
MTQSHELYQKLLEFDEHSLKAQLGIRVQERSRDPTARSASLESLDEALSATPRGGSPARVDVNFGDRYFKQLNVKTYNLMCGELFDDRELKAKLQASFKENYDKGVALLAPILASQFNIALSLAVIARLIVKTLFSATSTISSATSETIGGVWKEKLGDEKDMPDSEGLPVANSLA